MNKKNNKITFRVTEEEKNMLMNKADEKGISVSKLITDKLKDKEYAQKECIKMLTELSTCINEIQRDKHMDSKGQEIIEEEIKKLWEKLM